MIEIKNLSKTFSGTGDTVEALKNISITIADGDIYGIIGMSGAGKSTLVRCINMLERPTEGSVLIDGCDLSTLSEAELRKIRRNVTMIFQSFNLLAQRTCLKNICFPLELAGVPKAEAKTRAMELLELVGLPDKADAYPAQLSGGQKQRISIARVFLKDPKILILDEATSALDNESERIIQKSLEELSKNRTCITIAHRLSTIRNSNEIVVLDSNGLHERGTHEELMELNGTYARYYQLQFEGLH